MEAPTNAGSFLRAPTVLCPCLCVRCSTFPGLPFDFFAQTCECSPHWRVQANFSYCRGAVIRERSVDKSSGSQNKCLSTNSGFCPTFCTTVAKLGYVSPTPISTSHSDRPSGP